MEIRTPNNGLVAPLGALAGIAALVGIAALAGAGRGGDPGGGAAPRSGTPQTEIAAPPAAAAPASTPLPRVEITGAAALPLEGAALAARPTALRARDRSAWRLPELLPDIYALPGVVIHAITNEGQDYILRGDGRTGEDAVLVRRDTGELYIGWLAEGAEGRPLADAERPGERIERIVRIAVEAPAAAHAVEAPAAARPEHAGPPDAPAPLALVVDGRLARALDAGAFAAEAAIPLGGGAAAGAGGGEARGRALEVARALGGDGAAAELVGLQSARGHLAARPPAPGARPAVSLNRRGRWKLVWLDPAGAPLAAGGERDVTRLELRVQRP